ncbi:hypothetical protein [Streptomyces sp. NPDC001068]|uniref:hypothetical protein n=1 Tax=Streptomyces sp. NPDC001068 TaxID=3364544 RepID=UPI0036A1E86B
MPKAGITYGPRIAAPDYEQIARDAERQVLEELGLERAEDLVAKARPDTLVVKAAEVLQQADAELAAYLGDRDRALAHLWFYEQRLGLAKTVGLTNIGYRQILAKMMTGDKRGDLPANLSNEELVKAAEEAGIERVENAEAKLLETAPIVFAARTRRDVAVRYMQEAVLALSQEPYGWSPDRIAEHAGVHRDLIYKQRRTARKRHGM